MQPNSNRCYYQLTKHCERLRIAFDIPNAGNGNHQKTRAKVSSSKKYDRDLSTDILAGYKHRRKSIPC